MMPKMDGLEAVAVIRKLGGKYEKLPIIALTANAVTGMRETYLAGGFNDFMSKPILMRELNETLIEWMPPEKIEKRTEPELPAADSEEHLDSLEKVDKIDEINTSIALNHFSGMKEMYLNTLEIFHKKLVSECDSMSASLDAQDMKHFSISVHAMKSSLKTIGAMEMSETAFELETASKSQDIEFCVQLFPEFRDHLMSLHKKLSDIYPKSDASSKKEPGNIDDFREDVAKALAAAEDYDDDTCLEIIKKLLPYDFGAKTNALLEEALATIEDFEFEGAAKILQQI